MSIKILLIEDDELDQMIFKRSLKDITSIPTNVDFAINSSIALQLLEKSSYDMIFLDYMLPGSDGLLLLQKIRAMGIDVPIIVLTSQGNEKIAVEMMKAGASDYVLKNMVKPESLAQILRNSLRLISIENEKKKAEEELKISRQKLSEAQRIAKLGNWEFNIQTKEVFWSDEVYRIFGVDMSTYKPSVYRFFKSVLPEDKVQLLKILNDPGSQEIYSMDFRIRSFDGTLKFVNSKGYFQTRGESTIIVGTIQDISLQKQKEEELKAAKELAEKSEKVKEEFLANMSHEIRTPLNAVLGFSQLLFNTSLTDEQKSYLQTIKDSGDFLLGVINDILDFSKIQAGRLELKAMPFSLNEITDYIKIAFENEAKIKNLQFEVNIPESFQIMVKGDLVRLCQVMSNFVSNSLKFTESGKVAVNVEILGEDKNNIEVGFSVSDTGRGIPEEMLPHIFSPFSRLESKHHKYVEGTGLGLSIVKNILDQYNSQINVSSTPGKGSEFSFIINFDKAEATEIKQEQVIESKVDTFNSARILLAEDNPINRLLAVKVLNQLGFEVFTAENGVKAIEILKKQKIDLVLMDIQMPEMDGIEATQFIREKLDHPKNEVPIIAMSARAISGEDEQWINSGMNDYIYKPFQIEDLNKKILKNINKKIRVELKHINLNYLKGISNNNSDFIVEFLEEFRLQTPKMLDELKVALQGNDYNQVAEIAHKIKPTCGFIGSERMEELISTIEKCSHDPLLYHKIPVLIDETYIVMENVSKEIQHCCEI